MSIKKIDYQSAFLQENDICPSKGPIGLYFTISLTYFTILFYYLTY